MWEPQWNVFASTNRVVRCDLRGFGRTGLEAGEFAHSDDVVRVLDRVGVDRALLVGASLGGRVAMELAVRAPERVSGLLLSGSGLPGHDWSPQVQSFWQAEDELIERGDIDAAVELNLSMWLDGPERSRARVDSGTRARVAKMQRTAIEHSIPHLTDAVERLAVNNLAERIGEIRVPTAVVVGDQDVRDIRDIASTLATTIPNATLHLQADTAHLPSLEEPQAFNNILRQLLE